MWRGICGARGAYELVVSDTVIAVVIVVAVGVGGIWAWGELAWVMGLAPATGWALERGCCVLLGCVCWV